MCKERINQNATVEGKNMAPTYSHLSKDLITGTTRQSQRQMGQGCKPDFVSDIRYTSFKVCRSVWRV